MAPVVALLLFSVAHAESATTRERARLRQGPSAATDLLGELDVGTRVELLGENAGWRQVRTQDGRTGYVWAEHLAPREGDGKPADTARRPESQTTGARTLAEEVRELREEVIALRQRPEPATGPELARVRQELERVATAHRDLARRLDERFVPGASSSESRPDGSGPLASALLAVGAVAGFAVSRLVQRRRDHRQRNRLRL